MIRTQSSSPAFQKFAVRSKPSLPKRLQSSYSFYNVQVALQNGNKNKSQPRKFKNLQNSINRFNRSICHTEKFENSYNHHKHDGLVLDRVNGYEKFAAQENTEINYSWLPKAPTTHHLHSKEFNTDLFYSGYRPLSIDVNELLREQENPCTCYEISLSLDVLKQNLQISTPWVLSASGTEVYKEWDNIPKSVLDHLQCFNPPAVSQSTNVETSSMENTQSQIEEQLTERKTVKSKFNSRRRKPFFNLVPKK